ncbi:MAG: PspC domain-containing protein [Legionella longbeachae]|nr:PspC domain-containing protein [Legionella longbeachae]
MTQSPYKKLWRSRKDSKIAGICGGLGAYFGVDPIWIRIIFVIFFILGGAAFIAYILLWILIPLEPEDWHDANTTP